MERPILFSADMVRAILSGTKTQTRRLVKPQPIVSANQVIFEPAKGDFWVGVDNGHFSGHSSSRFRCPYGNIGDHLWVRETWRPTTFSLPNGAPYDYRATAQEDGVPLDGKWKPSIHMPRAACRLLLRVIDVRVERLNSISEIDAKAEGTPLIDGIGRDIGREWGLSYAVLWSTIYGADSWNTNPFVWVIEFEIFDFASDYDDYADEPARGAHPSDVDPQWYEE